MVTKILISINSRSLIHVRWDILPKDFSKLLKVEQYYKLFTLTPLASVSVGKIRH